ncbi:hypothetical protein K435DRAFT_863286 [Dendrothele bispora CBS 962.96]|uniref:Uncharacterized protein n=1 Tax=Dendrothele bispora (strain CBS 962.96) TaxID=1314807 RepID=A0A4S8LQ50_DENBC|nr:hypothetical protein K435DRAFT_863286 [Dendrothele bispora CBS 962.96]
MNNASNKKVARRRRLLWTVPSQELWLWHHARKFYSIFLSRDRNQLKIFFADVTRGFFDAFPISLSTAEKNGLSEMQIESELKRKQNQQRTGIKTFYRNFATYTLAELSVEFEKRGV